MGQSAKWKTWNAIMDAHTCVPCRIRNGKIYEILELILEEPPLHIQCRCRIIFVETIIAGSATNNGHDGADFHLLFYGD
ncbi:MAG: hypothetical protein GXY32_04415 [Ruminococcaceae bacterium]|nr:hypothetical protein [Oscillospiraceae bacterium]